MSYLNNMTPHQFEDFCRRLLQSQGLQEIRAEFRITADIRVGFLAQDAQGKQVVVEVKQTGASAAINNLLLQVSSFQRLASAERAIVIISRPSPRKAVELAASLNVEIWDEEFIQNVVEQNPELFGPPQAAKFKKGEIRLNAARLLNFRGVHDLTLDLLPVTVLVGKNGAGKSTILDALAIALSSFCKTINPSDSISWRIGEADIRVGAAETTIQLSALIEGDEVTWEVARVAQASSQRGRQRELTQKVAVILENYITAERPLPVVVYYLARRAVQTVAVDAPESDAKNRLSDLYGDAIRKERQDFKGFFEWFRRREDLENEKRVGQLAYRDAQLEAVRTAILSILDDFSDLRIERAVNKGSRMVAQKGSEILDIVQLSDGEKCMLGMVGDLARRLAIANPGAENPLEGSGVVLIDEIELHLHPQWQRRVIPFLTQTFPNCQFIVSTHSAPVISHIDNQNKSTVFLMDRTKNGIEVQNIQAFGQDVNRILRNIFDIPERPVEVQNKIDKCAQLIDAEEYTEADHILKELEQVLGDDPYLVYLRISIQLAPKIVD